MSWTTQNRPDENLPMWPSALVLTAIVIGLGVTAVMLSYAVRIYKAKKSLSIEDCTESKW